ncbi:MAG: TlpA family protein disulfide reductase [Gammaproteobacteria bacterium]|nr:TlpA family protein disulfide reductase [Gammaproteobacteria bacterium]
MKFRNPTNLPISIIAVALVTLSLSQFSYASEIKPGDKQPMPNIRWLDTEEQTHHLKDTQGKPRLLHFWAAWCFPCRKELPDMLEWKKNNPDILIIPLSLDERMAQSKYFIKKYQLSMSALLVDKNDSDSLDIPALPFTIFVSADGTYSGNFYGIAPWGNEEFGKKIRQHFKLD